MAAQSTQCWVWCPASQTKGAQFKHPAEVPLDDEDAARACFVECVKGPRVARISPAMLLQTKGNLCLIAEKGATREVPKYMVLPWYEGLLILETLEANEGQPGFLAVGWFDSELKAVLDKERGKFSAGRLNGTLYAEKRLINIAVTGARFSDGEREWQYRREKLRSDDIASLADGEDAGGYFGVKEVIDYLPPWEAFLKEKCGFYQEFYQVQWSHPFSVVDYSSVENGSGTGATWEPDECLPADLDALRLQAKKTWIRRRREAEKEAAKRPQGSPSPGNAPSASPSGGSVKRPNVVTPTQATRSTPPPPAKVARLRRDGEALDRDMMHSRVGHDFEPGDAEKKLGHIRSGWPKSAAEYPRGYAVASPPGFCWAECDCMDDARPQRTSELRKGWLEDLPRAEAAKVAIAAFSEQKSFVFRRGTVSKRCYFETATENTGDLTHAQAASDLAHFVDRALHAVLQKIPAASLSSEGDPVIIPARMVLSEDLDYEPLRFMAASDVELPPWARVDSDTGRLALNRLPTANELPAQLRIQFAHAEGRLEDTGAHLTVTVIPDMPTQAWVMATKPLVDRFADVSKSNLERGVRASLQERFSEIYDFDGNGGKGIALQRPLGVWLDVMGRILRLLRSAAGANLAFPHRGR
mmetsp:Transcript_16192/g.48089  ORF Transcript_16192/g.48089 Transcript_16192/m.48089 type:complete len:641 (-) Transcript_16192:72-1994(-)